jgi:chemotaxis response regulator CheB
MATRKIDVTAGGSLGRWKRIAFLLVMAGAVLVPARSLAFWNVAVGDQIKDRDLATYGGARQPLFGHAQATVFVLFRPNHDFSLQTLRDVARLQSTSPRSVRFVAVASSTHAPAAVRAILREAGLRATVLVDQRDSFAEELGTDVRPVVAIVDEGHRLATYQPYLSVNMHDTLRAELRRVLDRGALAQR